MIIVYASFRKKQRENARKALEKKIEELENKHKASGETSVLKTLQETRTAMNEFLNLKVEKILSILRQRTFDGGPRAAKVLAYKLKFIDKKSKELITGRREIANTFTKYYQDLYDAAHDNLNKDRLMQFFQKIKLPKATEEQNTMLTKTMWEEEICSHINKLKTCKSPGSDRFKKWVL